MNDWSNWSTHTWDFNLQMVGQYVEPYPGDLNDDRSVDLSDLVQWAQNLLANDCIMLDWCDSADVNWNSDVQLDDYSTIAHYWGSVWDGYEDLNRAAIAKRLPDMSGDNIDGSDGNEFTPGTYFVYRTSAGRFGKFLVENFDKADGYKLTISWTTYNTNGSIYTSDTGLVIRGTFDCDLDLGLETTVGADFWWVQQTSSTRYLDPQNGALFDLIYRAP
jgi:hypothetical protein